MRVYGEGMLLQGGRLCCLVAAPNHSARVRLFPSVRAKVLLDISGLLGPKRTSLLRSGSAGNEEVVGVGVMAAVGMMWWCLWS
jgi:hypothetical protein